MKLKLGIAAGVLAVAVAATAFWAYRPGHVHSDADNLFAHLQARSAAQDAVWLESSFADMLPSRLVSVNGGPPAVRNAGVVIGSVIDVRAGRGFAHPDDAPASTLADFNADDALWRTVEVTIAIEESFGYNGGASVTFAVVIDRGADAAIAFNGLRTLGRVIVSLDRQGRFAYAPGLYSISHSGDLFGTVDAQGNVEMTAMEDGPEFLNGLDTVAELRAEAAKAPTTVNVNIIDGVPTPQ